jgi:ArsR family transcriptional regulator
MNPASIFKALSDETRLRIVNLLSKHGRMAVSDLVAALDMPQWHVSRHLGRLRAAGLVDAARSGPCICYSLREDIRQAISNVVEAIRGWLDESTLAADLARLREALKRRRFQDQQ